MELALDINTNGFNYNDVIGEFASMAFYDFSHWREDPRNKDSMVPIKTLVHDIFSVLPDMKLIVILRNPISRLYSNFKMFRKSSSPEIFHHYVLGSIGWWEKCTEQLPERNCAFGSPPGMPPVYDQLDDRTQWWRLDRNYSGEIRNGMYGLVVEDWLAVVPRPYDKHLLFLKMEDYSANLAEPTKILYFHS